MAFADSDFDRRPPRPEETRLRIIHLITSQIMECKKTVARLEADDGVDVGRTDLNTRDAATSAARDLTVIRQQLEDIFARGT